MSPRDGDNAVSTFRRLRTTPLRDLLRGRLSGRLSPEVIAFDAGLPAPLRDLVRETARRTRLFRAERAEVAQELASHFAEGLGAGRTPDELARAFGDARTAARLIRRAKRRNRSLAMRGALLGVKGTAALVALLVVAYVGLALRHWGAKLGPMVDYHARLTARAAGVAPDERAWPVYRDALLASGYRAWPTTIEVAARPGWRDWPALVELLDRERALLDAARRGARMGGLGLVIGELTEEDLRLWPDLKNRPRSMLADALIEVLLPHLGEMHRIATLVAADIRRATHEGDGQRVGANVETLFGLADQVRETPVMLCDLVALGIAHRATDELLRTLDEAPGVLSDDDLGALAHRIAAFPRDGEPLVRLSGERMLQEDFVQRVFTLDDDGDGVLVPGALDTINALSRGVPTRPSAGARFAEPIAAALLAGRKETLDLFERERAATEAWARRPLWERRALPDPHAQLSAVDRVRLALPLLLAPSYKHALLEGEVTEQLRDATLTAIALELFRRREGRWPEALAALTPDLLPRVPVDRFDGLPLRYAALDGRPVLYSVGNNYRDDGGVAPREGSAAAWLPRELAAMVEAGMTVDAPSDRSWERTPAPADGDWVLFPPARLVEPAPGERFRQCAATSLPLERSTSSD